MSDAMSRAPVVVDGGVGDDEVEVGDFGVVVAEVVDAVEDIVLKGCIVGDDEHFAGIMRFNRGEERFGFL